MGDVLVLGDDRDLVLGQSRHADAFVEREHISRFPRAERDDMPQSGACCVALVQRGGENAPRDLARGG
jgi:hypothetical protein